MAAGAPAEWRTDIQGMRAVGSLLVAIFHIWVGGVSGGVDVFFVVAGYLMTGSALREIAKTGSYDMLSAWTRLTIRLFPSLILCLAAVFVLTFAFAPRPVLADAFRLLAAAAAYVHNWYLIWLGLHPLPRSEVQHMTQHFWAIAVIGQAYLLMPLLLGGAVRLGSDIVAKRRAIGVLLAAIVAASFVYGVIRTAHAPDAAYYDLFARLWEFAIGGLVALRPNIGKAAPPQVAAAASWAGIALLLTFGALIGSWANMPGFVSLWPSAAAALILIFGRTADVRNAGWLLSRAPLVWLGSLSYGIYLWHWPFTIIVLDRLKWQSISIPVGVAIIVAAIAMSWLTRVLSRRILSASWLKASPRRTSLLLTSVLLTIAIVSLLVSLDFRG